jgi:hypothetical protein
MAKKIFSHANLPLNDDYVQPVVTTEDTGDTPLFLASHDDKEWFSYDDAKVTVTAGQGSYAVTVYDSTDDADALTAMKDVSDPVRQGIETIESDATVGRSTLSMLALIAADDATEKARLTQVTTDKAAYLTSLGF